MNKPNTPKSPKTNSQGADYDKLNAAIKRRHLNLSHKGTSRQSRLINKLLRQQDSDNDT